MPFSFMLGMHASGCGYEIATLVLLYDKAYIKNNIHKIKIYLDR